MLESLAAWVLRTYVGEYVENLNTDQLSIGYGTVELENLPLKKTALQGLELPLEVKSGFIGHLKLSIPFRHPKSEPWIIHIDKLYLIAGPQTKHQYDEEQEKKREREQKQKQLDSLEVQWQFGRSKENETETWWTSLYSSLSTTVMENLQLVITGVHIRYEDNVIDQNNPFAVGITIEKLAVESANEKWEPEFLVSESITKFKLIEIQKFALYWDSDTSLVGDLPSKDLSDALHRVIGRGHGKASFSQHEYILNPVSSQVKLQRNRSPIPLRSKNDPRFILDIHLEEIPITLSDVQYQGLSKLIEEFQRHFRSRKYRKWKPLCSKKHNSRIWWQFAGKCILNFIQERNKRHTWSYTLERAQNIVKYVNVYTKHLTEPIEDSNQKEIQQQIEDKLTFEELKVLRSIAVANVRKEEALRKAAEVKLSQSVVSTQADANAGWLSGWWGWYGTSEETQGTSIAPVVVNELPQTTEEEQFLEEIQESNVDDSIFKRDTVFAHLNFHLDRGHFKLMTTTKGDELQPLIEVLYTDVRWRSQVSPRSSTWQSNMSLGSVFIKDEISEGNIFPYLVSPQSKVSGDFITEGHMDKSISLISIFELQFEKMPKTCKVGYSLKMKTQPIQVVFNPATIKRISNFFRRTTDASRKADLHVIEQQILDAAWARYEQLKSQTKHELYHAMDNLLLGQVKTQDKRWNIELFIASPQIILPESFHDNTASMILVDLGNLSFVTKSGTAKTSQENVKIEKMEVEDDGDDFVTPPSTPPSQQDSSVTSSTDLTGLQDNITTESLADKIYDRYTLEFADLQVLVAKIGEYTKRLPQRGTAGPVEDFSIVDKFTISLQLERRLIFTADPKWPSVTVSGDLPKLNLYFSEIKIQAMWKCIANLCSSNSPQTSPEQLNEYPSNLIPKEAQASRSLLDLTETDYYELTGSCDFSDKQLEPSLSHNSSEASLDNHQKPGQLSEESCLVLGQFLINELCVCLFGRGRLIAELKVDGVKSEYTKRPYDMFVSLSVFSISLMDHMQTYGPEYEMLLSSHRIESTSNSESDSTTPVYCVTPGLGSTNKVLLLDVSQRPKEESEIDSLITLDYSQVDRDSPSSSSNNPKRIASIQFNTMNIIANQETVVELMNFVNSLFPTEGKQLSSENLKTVSENEETEEQLEQNEGTPVAMEITATFHQLHLLIVRGLLINGVRIGRKVADINIIDLWTQVTLGDKQVIEGSLGGLHVTDVTPEDIIHRTVLSVGCGENEEAKKSIFQESEMDEDSTNAFTFTLVKPKQNNGFLEDFGSPLDDEILSKHIRLSVHMASAHYTYTHRFISELTLCICDFSSYANDVAQSLRSAATSMAIGLVTKQTSLADGIDYLSSSFTTTPGAQLEHRLPSRRCSLDMCDDTHDAGHRRSCSLSKPGNKRRVYVHMSIESPVIKLPRTASSSECLVAHLGRIIVYNTHLASSVQNTDENCVEEGHFNDIDRLYVDITDMSLDFIRELNKATVESGHETSEKTGDDNDEHILHDTTLRLVIDRCSQSGPGTEEGESLVSKPMIHISGRVTKPLQLVLSNNAYQQLLSTMDTLSGKTERDHVGSSRVTSPLVSPASSSHDFTTTHPNSHTASDEPQPMNTNQTNLSESPEVLTINPDEDQTPVRASFDIPEFNIELKGVLKDGEQGIVKVFFQDFALFYKKTEKATTSFDVSLGGLIVEDLLQSPESLYRNLMVSSAALSKTPATNLKRSNALSRSCPDIPGVSMNNALSISLPMTLQHTPRKNGLRASSPLRPMFKHRNIFPTDKVPVQEEEEEEMGDSINAFLGKRSSLKGEEKGETLVKIKAVFVDKCCAEYVDKYDRTDRFVEVDFNSLDTTVNLQTWVVFLEFFGIGKAPEEMSASQQQEIMKTDDRRQDLDSVHDLPNTSTEQINSQFKVRVASLSLTLNKAKYPLAKIKITGLSSLLTIREDNVRMKGKLMKINLMDMSPHGKMYREKFTTCGEEALDFDYFRYGAPDLELHHDCDMMIKLRMSAVQYIHTKRFQSELMAFFTHFSQIQESLRRMRTVAAGNEVAEASTRATRMSLDISAGSPLILFPKSSKSCDLLVANLGRMTLRNKFIFDGDEGSIFRLISAEDEDDELDIITEKNDISGVVEPPCLLDHMEVELVDIDLFSAVSCSEEGQLFMFKKQGNKLFQETCKLGLMVERNLDWARSRAVPDMSIRGALSSMYINLDYSQYDLILGFLNDNLGEALEEFERPSSFVADAFGDPTSTDTNMWTTLKMIIDLVNVKVELLPTSSLHDSKTFINPGIYSLAKIDFIKSKFVYEAFSDWSKTMDLVSQDVLLYDTRYEGSNDRCFKEVLRPGKHATMAPSRKINALMFEAHYRDSPTRTTMTFIFNNSRITLILDAMLDIYNFIMVNWDKQLQDQDSQNCEAMASEGSTSNTSQIPPSALETGAGSQSPAHPEKGNKNTDKNQKSFEMKVNISGSEFVALQNFDVEDTDAVVLRITAVVAWRPHYKSQKPLSCSIQSLEVFSCNLACEEESALSIIDPMAGLVELNAAERLSKRKTQGLLDATLESLPSLEITLNSLNMRISYKDYKLFLSIGESVSRQLSTAMKMERSSSFQENNDDIGVVEKQYIHAPSIQRLQELGFSEEDCIRALNTCRGDVESAATWLLLNAKPLRQPEPSTTPENKSKLSGYEIRANSICVCLIDDCGTNDVPLTELLIQHLYFWYELHGAGDSSAQCTLTADYYNRSVSGWEPLVEPWKCQVHWQKQRNALNSPENILVKVDAADRLDLNITSSFITMIQNTLKNWSEDYYGPSFMDSSTTKRDLHTTSDSTVADGNAGHFRKRAPFVPFLLRNQTGCPLHFATVTSSPSKLVMTTTGLVFSGRVHTSNLSDSSKKLSEWREVLPGGEIPFEFKQSREKQRHKETHELKVHQLVVQIEGWKQLSPVSVDKVGAFFRQAMPADEKSSQLNLARVVFEIKLENGAQKVVTVKSALVVSNKTDMILEMKLDVEKDEPHLPPLAPQSTFAIPLPYVQCHLFIRPMGMETKFSSSPLEWKNVTGAFENIGGLVECASVNGIEADNYRYCVSVQRDGFPLDDPSLQPENSGYNRVQPAHTITIMPPIVLVNLLPIDLAYFVHRPSLKGNIKPGRLSPLYKVNRSTPLDFKFTTENFPLSEGLIIPDINKGIDSCIRHIELKDQMNRILGLNAKIELRQGGSIRISIFASFWLVNDTGIPLIFKQEGNSQEMAGQFDEHEVARSLTPLLFSFSDRDGPFRCTAFSLEYPREFTRIHSRQPDRRPDNEVKKERKVLKNPRKVLKNPRKEVLKGHKVNRSKTLNRKVSYEVRGGCSFHVGPEEIEHGISLVTAKSWVYDVGIDVRFGQGRFRDTRIVTFAPRYQFENRSSHPLAFQQRHFVREQETSNPDGTLTSPPSAQIVWHWERTDLDQLLCIRLNDVSDCRWSGGFRIDRDDSSHVIMRCSKGCLFIRAEVMLKGAVFHIVFTDANQLPPPYRIENLSEVAVLFYQSRTEDHQRCLLQPKQSVPYAWDEPTLPRQLTLGIVNDGSFVHFDLEKLGEKDKLYYYNAIYIAFTHTFTNFDGSVSGSFHIHPVDPSSSDADLFSKQLVLDVPQGSAVILSKKEPYKRSQLWRMTLSGILFNEGSSPLFDARKPSSSRTGLVLDVSQHDASALVRGRKPLQLVISKMSAQRKTYQTWSFKEDGRMRNRINDYCVQPKLDGVGLHQGVDVVLSCIENSSNGKVPIEQLINVQKLRPGSGMLLVKVLADGPTRTVRITDVRQQNGQGEHFGKDWMVVEGRGTLRETTLSGYTNDQINRRTEIQIRLAGGIGVSLINSIPEELLFATFNPIEMDYVTTASLQTLDINIGNIQVDDQLHLTQYPVMLFLTPSSKENCTSNEPVLRLSIAKEPTKLKNCEIFKHLEVSLRKLTLQVDERLLFKLLQLFGWVYSDDDVSMNQDSDDFGIETQRTTSSVSPSSLKRHYFEKFLFNPVHLRVSVATVTRLPEDLQQIKSSLGLILVRLQGAIVDLESFSRCHGFDTRTALLDALSKHYVEELRGQAPFILASVDFLGNPMGLFNDVSSGLEGLVRRGNVGGLFLNVAHGLSDSAAKLTGSLSDGLWSASSDSKSLESREAMRAERHHQSSGDHLLAGIKGLGMGLVGGLTSMVTQPIEGASEKGVPGFIQGLGKGILGTFAKPTAGVLDFASGLSAAVRGSATSSSRRYQPKQIRTIRNCFGPGGAIPRFSKTNSEGQFIVLKLNANNMNEKFITSESVRTDTDGRVKVLLTNERIYFVKTSGVPSPESILVSLKFEDVLDCHHLKNESVDYVELSRKFSEPPVRVRCEAASAQKLVQKINYAKSLFEEVKQTVIVKAK